MLEDLAHTVTYKTHYVPCCEELRKHGCYAQPYVFDQGVTEDPITPWFYTMFGQISISNKEIL